MALTWFAVLSAVIFCIGAAGVLTRRNPLVILLCLELMLNGANLALLTFSRMHGNGDGQIFAIIVVVVAACCAGATTWSPLRTSAVKPGVSLSITSSPGGRFAARRRPTPSLPKPPFGKL